VGFIGVFLGRGIACFKCAQSVSCVVYDQWCHCHCFNFSAWPPGSDPALHRWTVTWQTEEVLRYFKYKALVLTNWWCVSVGKQIQNSSDLQDCLHFALCWVLLHFPLLHIKIWKGDWGETYKSVSFVRTEYLHGMSGDILRDSIREEEPGGKSNI
jgi:hypothetical protein